MQSGRTELIITPRAQAAPVALVAQSASLLSLNADSLERAVQDFILCNPLVEGPSCSAGGEGDDPVSAIPAAAASLGEQLYFQLSLNETDPALLRMGWYIINSLDRDGYLREEESELIRAAGGGAALYERALAAVQRLDPPGIAARSLGECLCLQLSAMAEPDPLALEIAAGHLEALACGSLRLEGYDEARVAQAVALIRSLDPRPGLRFDGARPPYVQPDVRIELGTPGEVRVSLVNQPAAPSLSAQYAQYLKIEDAEQKQYVRDNLAYARSFLYALEQRGKTLLRIASHAAAVQEGYLRQREPGALMRLSYSAAAEALQMSVSTVSRGVKEKYAECGGKTFPLARLFTSGGLAEYSREFVAGRMKRLLAEHGPLSDRALTELLAQEGVEISRRAVNKYRRLYLGGRENGRRPR